MDMMVDEWRSQDKPEDRGFSDKNISLLDEFRVCMHLVSCLAEHGSPNTDRLPEQCTDVQDKAMSWLICYGYGKTDCAPPAPNASNAECRACIEGDGGKACLSECGGAKCQACIAGDGGKACATQCGSDPEPAGDADCVACIKGGGGQACVKVCEAPACDACIQGGGGQGCVSQCD
jgi:hypothetical protein